jgi:hypothetical protein
MDSHETLHKYHPPEMAKECDDAVARSKIPHGFRNARMRSRAKEKQQLN